MHASSPGMRAIAGHEVVMTSARAAGLSASRFWRAKLHVAAIGLVLRWHLASARGWPAA
jgi:hypothetical protein